MAEDSLTFSVKQKNNGSLSEQAYTLLKQKIMNEKSGAFISARSFSKEVGISYTPVREAFLRCQKEGALTRVPNVGFFVQSLDLPDLLQILEVREVIELFVWDRVFDRIGSETIAQMKTLVKQQREAIARGDVYQYQRFDMKIHEIPFRIYGNIPLLRFYQNIREQYMICSKRVATAHGEESTLEHTDIIENLEARDKEGVLRGIRKHLAAIRERMSDGYIHISGERYPEGETDN